MFLSVGEISPNKNQTNAIKALAKVNNPRVKYFIAGQGDLQTEVEKLIEEHHLFGQVELLGYRTDIPDLCGAADAYLFPSFREGLSVALMEAMACGLPVVASRIRGNTDLIDEGKGGYLVDPRDAEGMAQAIKTLVANPEAAAMGQYNMEKVKDFDMEKVTQALRRIYQSVMPESENSAES
jgi:glycosyltransferase involved in cell wall biosynthesis